MEWFNNNAKASVGKVTVDLWGNPYSASHTAAPAKSELKKTIYDPCPPGYMVPPIGVWDAVSRGGCKYVTYGLNVPDADGGYSYYPYAGYISDLNSGESANRSKLGWFAYYGFDYAAQGSTHGDRLAVRMHSSQTSNFAGAYMGSTTFYVFTGSGDPDGDNSSYNNYPPYYANVRQAGCPVRCMKID